MESGGNTDTGAVPVDGAPEIAVAPATAPEDVAAVRELFRDYAGFMGFRLCFQGFDEELAGLPGAYAPPSGELLLCRVGGVPAGCVAVGRHAPGIAEMKRLFVRSEFRRRKVGQSLARLAMAMARAAGYESIRLETVPELMPVAVGMYRKLGFIVSPCPDGTDPRIVCYSRALSDPV